MSVADDMGVTYECANGHVNTKHKSQPRSAGKGFMPVCVECKARIERKLVPMYECEECGYSWAYTGDAEKPTCPECRGKRTSIVSDSPTET